MTTIIKEGYTKKSWCTTITCESCWAVLSVRKPDLYVIGTIYDDDYQTKDVYTKCPLCGHENPIEDYPPAIVDELAIGKSIDYREEPTIRNRELDEALIVIIVVTLLVILAGFAVFFL